MATNPKTAVLQIRMVPEQLAKFQLHCDALERSYSDVARTLIRNQVRQWEAELRRVAERQANPPPVPPKVTTIAQVTAKRKAHQAKKNRRS